MSEDRFQVDDITPEQFELQVKKTLAAAGVGLSEFSLKHREILRGSDGSYEIDITARFEVLGASFLVLIECKHHRSPIKREVVQVLYDRLRAVGAQKGMLWATASFQKGALEYAKAHGITLVRVMDGSLLYMTKAQIDRRVLPPWVPQFASCLVTPTGGGNPSYHSLFSDPQVLRAAIIEREDIAVDADDPGKGGKA